jgi:integrase
MESKTAVERVRFVTYEEYKKLLRATLDNPSVHLLFRVVGSLGLRISEAHRIVAGDLTPDGIIRIHTSKKKCDAVHEMGVPRKVAQVMRRWIKRHHLKAADRLFPWSLQRSHQFFHHYAKKAGLLVQPLPGRRGRGIHSLRHMFSLRLGEAGEMPSTISSLMRHGSLGSTLPYLHFSKTDKVLDQIGAVG